MRPSIANERVPFAHRQRDPQSCTMCLKHAQGYRRWRPFLPHLKWRFLLASCRWACNLRWSARRWLHGARVIVPRVLVHGPRNRAIFEQALASMQVLASQHCAHRHDLWMLISRHRSLSVARRRHPTTLFTLKSVRRDLGHCHEIHMQDVPDLAHASGPNCREQFLLELELSNVTEDNSDQRHTTSWVMYHLLHQIFLVTVALYT